MKVTKKLPPPDKDIEKIEAAKDAQARLIVELEKLEEQADEEISSLKSKWKSKLSDIKKNISKYAHLVVDGGERIEVECEELMDRDTKKIIVKRLDNGEVVEERDLDEGPLFAGGKPQKAPKMPKPKGSKKGSKKSAEARA